MKALMIFPVALLTVVAGCAFNSAQTRQTNPPAGPITAATSQRDVLPSGTELSIRVNQDISTKQAGGSFDAQIARNIVNQQGDVLIPAGSRAQLEVTQVNNGGVAGTKTMELTLKSITLGGTKHDVATLNEEQRGNEGIGANQRTAESVGGGAALGALLGAVIGGGKGAAAGAVIGAAGGAAAQVLTRGDEVRVPAETVLTFRLDQPMRIAG